MRVHHTPSVLGKCGWLGGGRGEPQAATLWWGERQNHISEIVTGDEDDDTLKGSNSLKELKEMVATKQDGENIYELKQQGIWREKE